MSSLFYWKLSLTTIKKNKKIYIPYILTCIGTVAMFYIVNSISKNQGLRDIRGGYNLIYILYLGDIIIGIFSAIFLLYTNSFLIKRRKKELGLYNILGMEKKHISKLITFETISIFLVSIILGIATGMILSKLMFLLLINFVGFDTNIKFSIQQNVIMKSIEIFAGIFVLILIYNLLQVRLSRPIELLKGGNVGEKEPKSRWILTIVGIICICSGYYIALTTENPLKAFNLFFTAVILVIIGTYALFVSGTITILKKMKKNKNYYYKPNHFIGISNMIFRMKQNAVGLANICVLSTMVLVMISTTTCLYIGVEDAVKISHPYDITIETSKDISKISKVKSIVEDQCSKLDMHIGSFKEYTTLNTYFYFNEGKLEKVTPDMMSNIDDLYMTIFISQDDYNRTMSDDISLKDDEIMMYCEDSTQFKDTVSLFGNTFKIKRFLDEVNIQEDMDKFVHSYYVIVPNIEAIEEIIIKSEKDTGEDYDYSSHYNYYFNVDGSSEEKISLVNALDKQLETWFVDSKETTRANYMNTFGGLFFIGIVLGLLFIMAAVLIIYYKQISEGYDDKDRFEIMQKVGLDKEMIKKSIKSQVKIVFFMPLITAMIHVAFAFKIINKLIDVFNYDNTMLFIKCTAGVALVFTIFYMIVYSATAKTYYNIVRE